MGPDVYDYHRAVERDDCSDLTACQQSRDLPTKRDGSAAGTDPDDLLVTFPSELVKVRPTSKRVNSPQNDDEGLRDSQRKLVEEAHAEYLDRLTNAWKGNRSTDA